MRSPELLFTDLQNHLCAIDELARHATDAQKSEMARELIDAASEILSYTARTPPAVPAMPNDPNAQLPLDKLRSLKRKAAMLRSYLQGETTAAIANTHGIVRQSVLLHLTEIIRVLRKRTRVATNFMGKDDALAGMSGHASQMTQEERIAYLATLGRFELELERREQGRSWSDVWR